MKKRNELIDAKHHIHCTAPRGHIDSLGALLSAFITFTSQIGNDLGPRVNFSCPKFNFFSNF